MALPPRSDFESSFFSALPLNISAQMFLCVRLDLVKHRSRVPPALFPSI